MHPPCSAAIRAGKHTSLGIDVQAERVSAALCVHLELAADLFDERSVFLDDWAVLRDRKFRENKLPIFVNDLGVEAASRAV
jgi:hypothetical protein